MDRDSGAAYIRDNFEPDDRLAVVLINRRSQTVIQRLSTARKIASADFQAWLRHRNAQQYDVYISMNALRENAQGRTKRDVGRIRHVYLDFDENGTAKLESLLKRHDSPRPNYIVATSPGKWQVVWKVEGFSKQAAEELQRGFAREVGADPAATDCARVLRLPGFRNHKYARHPLVRVEVLSQEIYGPERFPKFPSEDHYRQPNTEQNKRTLGPITQSEKDWAYARRALARGERPELVIAAIASYRRYDKHDPQYYAEHTVRKATESLRVESGPTRSIGPDR